MYIFSFEKLEVWNDSRELVKMIYGITTSFPNSEKYGLANQMNRAVISVSSNIAEGSGKMQSKDKARFIHISFGSLMELLNQLIIASDFGWIVPEQYQMIRSQIEKVANKLIALEKAWVK
jgi:four helix bundle protein